MWSCRDAASAKTERAARRTKVERNFMAVCCKNKKECRGSVMVGRQEKSTPLRGGGKSGNCASSRAIKTSGQGHQLATSSSKFEQYLEVPVEVPGVFTWPVSLPLPRLRVQHAEDFCWNPQLAPETIVRESLDGRPMSLSYGMIFAFLGGNAKPGWFFRIVDPFQASKLPRLRWSCVLHGDFTRKTTRIVLSLLGGNEFVWDTGNGAPRRKGVTAPRG